MPTGLSVASSRPRPVYKLNVGLIQSIIQSRLSVNQFAYYSYVRPNFMLSSGLRLRQLVMFMCVHNINMKSQMYFVQAKTRSTTQQTRELLNHCSDVQWYNSLYLPVITKRRLSFNLRSWYLYSINKCSVSQYFIDGQISYNILFHFNPSIVLYRPSNTLPVHFIS